MGVNLGFYERSILSGSLSKTNLEKILFIVALKLVERVSFFAR